MDRDEILKKAQAGAIGMDEREQQVLGLSFGIGGILMVLLCVILAIIRLVNGQDAHDSHGHRVSVSGGRRAAFVLEDPAAGLGVAGGGLRPGVRGQPGHVPAGVSAMDDQLILKNRLKVAWGRRLSSRPSWRSWWACPATPSAHLRRGSSTSTPSWALILCIALDKKFEELFYFE